MVETRDTGGGVQVTGAAFRPAARPMPRASRHPVGAVGETVRRVTQFVRLGVAGAVASLAACAHSAPRLDVSSVGAPVPIAGYFAGEVRVSADMITLLLDSARVVVSGTQGGRVTGVPGAGAAELTDVTVRAVLATDSAGHAIPLGVSGAVEVAERMRAGEARELRQTEFALPVPEKVRLADVWVLFQLRALAQSDGEQPQEILAYACSTTNLAGRAASAERRAERLRVSYTDACRV